MKTTKLASFTLKIDTINRLNEYAKKNSINKSALIDRLINKEIDYMETSIFDRLSAPIPENKALLLAPAEKQYLINEKKDSDEE